MIIFSRKPHDCWVPPFWENPISHGSPNPIRSAESEEKLLGGWQLTHQKDLGVMFQRNPKQKITSKKHINSLIHVSYNLFNQNHNLYTIIKQHKYLTHLNLLPHLKIIFPSLDLFFEMTLWNPLKTLVR